MPVVQEAVRASKLPRAEIGFTCSGSSDYLQGQSFAFVGALDAVGAWPPIKESHVEMDGAWALYEAWIKIQTGDVDSALVYRFGKSSSGDLPEILALQLDPYTMLPLWPDAHSLAALQARAFLEATGQSERDLAEVVARSRRDAVANPHAVVSGDVDVEKLLAEPYVCSPLRAHDLRADHRRRLRDGRGRGRRRARALCARPVWIRGIRSPDRAAGARAARPRRARRRRRSRRRRRASHAGRVDFAELHAPYSHQELILRAALGLGEDVAINPSGGALAAQPDDGRGADPDRRGGAADRGRARQSRGRARDAGPVPAAEPGLRAGGRLMAELQRRDRHRPDQVRRQAHRRVDARPGARGRAARARGRGPRLRTTSTPS